MPRLEAPAIEAMDDDQRRVHAAIIAGPRGKVEGPLQIWLHSPPLAERAQELGAFCRFHSTLEPRLSELAIISTGAFWRSGFEWAVHAPIAIERGLDPELVEAIRTDKPPVFALPDEEIVYRFTRELFETHSLSDATYAAADRILGTRRLVDLVGILGYYSLICLTINAFQVPAPVGQPDPFTQKN